MNIRYRLAPLAALVSVAAMLLLPAHGFGEPAATSPASPRSAEIRIEAPGAGLAEPLVATGSTTSAEDEALTKAVAAYARRSQPDDVSGLSQFLVDHPHSGWTASVQVNLGLAYRHYGYFSKAIEAWRGAWLDGRAATDPQARAMVDGAIGDLAHLYASLGHTEQLAALFTEVGGRPITGSATEAFQVAREQLTLVEKDPRHLFICGPMALRAMALSEGISSPAVNALQWYRAGPNGTSLAEVGNLADTARVAHRLVFRKPGQPVPVPSVVHWKVGHFAAIVGETDGRFHVDDPVFPGAGLWITKAALEAEASGYFLVPANERVDGGWRSVDGAEAAGVWGKGPTNGTRPGDAGDPPANIPPAGDPSPTCPLCGYNIKESAVSLTLADTPVGYDPAVGPSAKVKITYNQREDSQPQNFSFFNVSPKWTLNWLAYVTDDPTIPGGAVSRTLADGGAYYYTGYDAGTHRFAAEDVDGSITTLVSQAPVKYLRQKPDGSSEIYAQSDGSTAFPRRIFLSHVLDPQGNALTLNYDGQQRLVALTDAIGRQTAFSYAVPGRPLLVSAITDPFGRSARLTYDGNGRLSSITDIIGLTSTFAYDANSLVNALTTPYGTTAFSYTAPGTSSPPRFVHVTDPLGYHEREEWLEPAPIPDSDPPATVPQGMPLAPLNQYLTFRNSFHWDKIAYAQAGCTPTGGCDYTKARLRHFVHMPGASVKSTILESEKYPLENRVWFQYPGQTAGPGTLYAGTFNQPIATGRVLDDGTSQISRKAYDTAGYFRVTQTADPVGRVTQYTYAPNHIDLTGVTQTTAGGTLTPVAQLTYDDRHNVLASTDAAGQMTKFAYNAAGQPTSVSNALLQVTKYQYDGSGNLTSIINANNATAATFTYDALARVRTYTDSEGWTVRYDYDAVDRVTRITFPDGTTQKYIYDKLDLAAVEDRQARLWKYAHDANRRLTQVTDPLGGQTLYGYDGEGHVTSLTDPKTNVTSWTYDVQGRLRTKKYADNGVVTYAYEATTSRLKSITDALGQVKQLAYAKDDWLTGLSYANAVNPTPNVGFTYDPYFPRLAAMTDGTGTTQFSYVASLLPGALKPAGECLVRVGGSSCAYQVGYGYDELGRLALRTRTGSGAESLQYDAIGRLVNHASDLGSFSLSYLGQTGQITTRQLLPPGANLATAWGYLPNSADRRLASIGNAGLAAGQYTNFQFSTTPENLITSIAQTSDSPPATPAATTQAATYNALNQLTNLSGQAFSYDANGNLLSDGQRSYSWDAENRLVGISYPGQPGKLTAFRYDGMGRRLAIASTPTGGGSPVTTAYVWCGSRLCQARDAGNAALRDYYDEGEYVRGSSSQPVYYGVDQIQSVRRVFVATSNAPAYDYDPFGNLLQATAPLADFAFAGMFGNKDSELNLTLYRAYDPVVGRWLSRDPLGLVDGVNLYGYVGQNPIGNIDPTGLISEEGWRGVDDALRSMGFPMSQPAPKPATMCPAPAQCPPCTPYPAGTIGYLGPHDDHDHYPVGRPHLNLYGVNQNSECNCFWNKNNPDVAVPPPLPGWVDLNPGFPHLSPSP